MHRGFVGKGSLELECAVLILMKVSKGSLACVLYTRSLRYFPCSETKIPRVETVVTAIAARVLQDMCGTFDTQLSLLLLSEMFQIVWICDHRDHMRARRCHGEQTSFRLCAS